MSKPWIVGEFAAAFDQFAASLRVDPTDDLVRAGCIHYFEFTFELAWKSIKQCSMAIGLDPGGSPKSCLRTAFQQGWISDEPIWLEMLDSRNRMSHTYHAKDALQIYDRLPHFERPLRALINELRMI